MTKLLKDKASVKNSKQESQDTIAQIKAISLHPPYASLIKMGLKHFETRSWPTNYRGKLVICAAKKDKTSCKNLLCYNLRLFFCQFNLLRWTKYLISFKELNRSDR